MIWIFMLLIYKYFMNIKFYMWKKLYLKFYLIFILFKLLIFILCLFILISWIYNKGVFLVIFVLFFNIKMCFF